MPIWIFSASAKPLMFDPKGLVRYSLERFLLRRACCRVGRIYAIDRHG